MRRINLAASLIILGLVAISLGWLIPTHIPSAHDPGDLPPNLVPILSMLVFGLMAVLLGVGAVRRQAGNHEENKTEEDDQDLSFGWEQTLNLLLWLGAAMVIWLLLHFIGFFVAACATILMGALYGGLRNFGIIVTLALGMPLLIEKIVWYGLNIRLP